MTGEGCRERSGLQNTSLYFALRASLRLFRFADSYHPDTHPSGALRASHFAPGKMVPANRSTVSTGSKRDALQCARRVRTMDGANQLGFSSREPSPNNKKGHPFGQPFLLLAEREAARIVFYPVSINLIKASIYTIIIVLK